MVSRWIWTPSWSHCTSSWTTGGSSSTLRGHPKPVGLPCSANRRSSPWPSLPSASLPQREGLLALRLGTPAPLLPYVVLPGRAQSAHPSPGAADARVAARLRPRARRSFGGIPRPGYDPRPSDREGEGFSQGALRWSSDVREERLQDLRWVYGFKAALVVDPNGVITAFGLAPAASDERPIGEALVASDRYGAYLADKGFTGLEWERLWMDQYGALVAATP